jgi:protein-disulfide isomerase
MTTDGTRETDKTERDHRSDSSSTVSRRTLLALGTGAMGSLAGCNSFLLGPQAPDCSGRQITDLPAPVRGPASAPVSVAIYTDFACPHCKKFFAKRFPEVRQRIPQKTARYIHHDFPIPVSGKWSYAVASAARAVQNTKSDRAFWEFATMAFEHQNEYSMELLEQLARNVNAPPQTVRNAAEKLLYCRLLKQERKQGSERGVKGTPTVFVNDRKLEVPTADELVSAIKKAAG